MVLDPVERRDDESLKDWGLAKLKSVLAGGSDPHLMTGVQYKETGIPQMAPPNRRKK